ncbi:uncharacterized protein TRAVEDRAFT_38771 [Trametes versicolor FP-101664 SS1]|uniref:uncharacterized protein n=1 Tax=Trametes versicolor (strain FP-101664) TaxID=717944 RepID=UPI0004621E97|nr:uncharacterized protein TRAVEDRAFT_38771 [Trametes versicolor FP-101664 SS1]EIW55527.1 hypothetical protein TRAVEDRAFT_38771 [Trametes versicolor FP-101664 SS1]
MMEDLPIDTNHPAVREYLALIRLQVLTPLSLLINIATLMVCTFVLDPNLGQISELYPSVISPKPYLIAVFIVAIYVGQVGYCVLLVLSRKPETKRAIIQGCGFPLMLANWVMAFWAISWILQAFLLSTVLLGILLGLLLYANVVLLIYHAPTGKRPLDIAFIHAPVRLFLLLPLGVMFPYSLFVTLGLTWSPGEPQHYARGQWPGLAVMLGVNLLGLLVIVLRRDIVWCAAATWICASIWSEKPKPYPVFLVTVMFTVLHPAGLVASTLWVWLRGRRRRTGPIALPGDENGPHPQPGGERPAREVDTDALWG